MGTINFINSYTEKNIQTLQSKLSCVDIKLFPTISCIGFNFIITTFPQNGRCHKEDAKMEATEEMVNHFREFCEAKETPYKKCPADARQKMETVDVPMITAKYNALWQQADANGDGFLNEAEWISYNKLMHETA